MLYRLKGKVPAETHFFSTKDSSKVYPVTVCFCSQTVLIREGSSVILVVALLSSVLAILFGVFRRFCFVIMHNKARTSRASSLGTESNYMGHANVELQRSVRSIGARTSNMTTDRASFVPDSPTDSFPLASSPASAPLENEVGGEFEHHDSVSGRSVTDPSHKSSTSL